MREREEPVTKTINVSEARQQWGQLINQVSRKEARVLVEKSGIPVAAIVSSDDLRRLQQLDAERRRDFQILEATGEAFKDVPEEELEREVAKAAAEARAELRAERAQQGRSTKAS